MKLQLNFLHKQQGVAIITALLLTTLAITIVSSLFWQQQIQVRSIENQRLQLQKQWILRGALDWASLILNEDAKHSNTDTLDEPWAVPLAETRLDQYVDNGHADNEASDAALSGYITDAQGLFNLTNLCINGRINSEEVSGFAKLLDLLNIDTKFAQLTADLMAISQKNLSLSSTQNAQEISSQPIEFTQIDDLLTIQGLTPALLLKLKGYVIFLPVPTPLNVNTAPAEILAAKFHTLSIETAKNLVDSRNQATFKDMADFNFRLPKESLAASADQASTASNYFLVNGKVRMSKATLNSQALIERSAGKTKLIWVREL